MQNKITLPELVSLVAESTNTTKRMSELFLRELMATVSQALIDGQDVTITNLGTFKRQHVGGKASATLLFVPDKNMAKAINQPFEAFLPVELSDEVNEEDLLAIDNPTQEHVSDAESLTLENEQPLQQEIAPPPFDLNRIMGQTLTPDPLPDPMPVEEPNPLPINDAESVPESVQPLVDEPVSEVDNEPEQEPQPEEVPVENEKASANNNQKAFFRGLMAGAAAMAILGLLFWAIWGRKQDHKAETPVEKTQQVDSVANEQASIVEPKEQMVTDTISPHMQLFQMAKKHYGHRIFWVYIYEENKDSIANPNIIPEGTVLVIPPAEKYGIDNDDPQSVEKAMQRSIALFEELHRH